MGWGPRPGAAMDVVGEGRGRGPRAAGGGGTGRGRRGPPGVAGLLLWGCGFSQPPAGQQTDFDPPSRVHVGRAARPLCDRRQPGRVREGEPLCSGPSGGRSCPENRD